jgi:hypothetical protein
MPIKKVLSVRPYGQIFSLDTYDWFWNWFSFEDAIRLLTILSPEKDRQTPGTFSPPCISSCSIMGVDRSRRVDILGWFNLLRCLLSKMPFTIRSHTIPHPVTARSIFSHIRFRICKVRWPETGVKGSQPTVICQLNQWIKNRFALDSIALSSMCDDPG